MASCVLCKSKEVTQSWSILIRSLKIRQVFNICDSCASIQWSRFKDTESMQTIIIKPPYRSKDFEQEAKENNSKTYGSSWCEYTLDF